MLDAKRSLRGVGHQIWRAIYTRRHPDHPWLSPASIHFLDDHLTKEMRGLEWGSGRSTTWLALRLGELISIEHNPDWFERVRGELGSRGLKVDYRLIVVPADRESQDKEYWEQNPYVMVIEEQPPESLDFVLVDGMYRQHCVARAMPKIKRGGLLAVDNSAHLPNLDDWGVPPDWPVVVQGKPFRDTTIWRRP